MTTLYADGFLFESNPSPIGGGYTIVASGGIFIERKVIKKKGFTNNEAELLGILRAVELSKEGGLVITDSQVVLSWIRRGWSKQRKDLKKKIRRCKRLVEEKNIHLDWLPRKHNLAGQYNEEHPVGRT